MKIEGSFCDIDELTFGMMMSYGEDEIGTFHMTTIGLLLFEINLIRYIEADIT